MSKNYSKPPAQCELYANWKLLDPVLNLTGDARDAVLSIPVPKENLKSDEGLKLIMEKLDTLYEKDALTDL